MKKLLFALLFIFTLPSFAQDLTGKWSAAISEEEYSFIFDEEGYATMIMGKQVIGGKLTNENKQETYMIYTVDSSSKPFKMDMILYDAQTKKPVKKMLFIFEFIGEDQLRLAAFLEKKQRPKNFESKDDVIVLTKQEE